MSRKKQAAKSIFFSLLFLKPCLWEGVKERRNSPEEVGEKETQSANKDLGEGDTGILGAEGYCLGSDEEPAAGPRCFKVLGKSLHFVKDSF